MPRPNRPREVLAEDNLARRIAAERDARGWSNDGLAQRMTEAGCAMTGSAIFKIEKGQPRRRIVVDELVAFAKVFGVAVDNLLLPPEVLLSGHLADLVIEWNTAKDEAWAAAARRDEAWAALRTFATDHPEVHDKIEAIFEAWADFYYDEGNREAAVASKVLELTNRDEHWRAVVEDAMQAATGAGGDDGQH